MEDLQRTAWVFFDEQSHPHTGLVRDRARADGSPSEGKASIAASGFALSAWVVAAERGWTPRETAAERVRHALRFLTTDTPRRHGFFYHFMEMDTGARAWKCELSSIDSALLFAGAIVAREYFGDPEITALVNGLLADIDWAWFRNGGGFVSLGWFDETGFSRYRWDHYSEHILMSFLALGASPQPVEAEYWRAWTRAPIGRYGDFVYLQEPPLFVHQFPQAYLDLRDRRDAFADYFQNSRLATLAQRQFSLDLRGEFPLWGEQLWGVTASDSAGGYRAWGGPPRTLNFNALDGTIVPCAAAGSLPFAPQETLAVLHHLREAYGDRIWKRYGFVDAFNPHNGWVNEDVIGIDLGISLVQAENLRTGLIHRLFMGSPEARLGLAKAGLFSTRRQLAATGSAQLRSHAARAWQELIRHPAEPGLQLTATLAAAMLGLASEEDVDTAAGRLLSDPPAAEGPTAIASLLTLSQLRPDFAASCSAALDRMRLPAPGAAPLGSDSRLAAFLRVARGAAADEWSALDRTTQSFDQVRVLAPVSVEGALLPGLWLDERTILSGASASQFAYALLSIGLPSAPPDAATLALLLEHFPGETVDRLGGLLGRDCPGEPAGLAGLIITVANLLHDDALRAAFQRDPLVRAGRAAIAEFAAAPFGPNTSLVAHHELAPPQPGAFPRLSRAVPSAQPRDTWEWHGLAGPAFKDSNADVRPDDAPISLRFAFTWDESALHFHAEVTDTPPGYVVPEPRNRFVELPVDPAGDGHVWSGAGDRLFVFRSSGEARELFASAALSAQITPSADGYTVAASIPWSSLGLTPQPGLEFGVSPAVVSEGTREWEAMLKLNWSFQRGADGRVHLGRLRLD